MTPPDSSVTTNEDEVRANNNRNTNGDSNTRPNGVKSNGQTNPALMNGIQLKPMPRYKRAEFDDADTVSTTGSLPDPVQTGSSMVLTMGHDPSRPVPKVLTYTDGGFPRKVLWDRASPLEKFLMVLVTVLSLVILILAIVISAQTGSRQVIIDQTTKKSEYCLTPPCITVSSAILNAMDLYAHPCDDFYQYACGGWIKDNPLPEGKSIWSTFGKLWQENQVIMKNVLEDEKRKLASKAEQNARVYYNSCLDKNDTVEALGEKPIVEKLYEVGGWNISKSNFSVSTWNLEETLHILHNVYSRSGLFSWAVGADERNSSRHILQIDQGGLSLPSRDYYLNKTEDDKVLVAYLSYITQVGVILGGNESDVKEQAKEIIKFETLLANITIPNDERRDDEQLYNKMNISQLQTLSPLIGWVTYFNKAFAQINRTITEDEEIVVYAPDYLSNLSTIVNKYMETEKGKTTLANYLCWHMVNSLVPCLSETFREAFKVLRKALMGSDGSETTWRYCVSDTNNVLGFALGAMFVREVFDGEGKPLAETMLQEVKDAFKENLPNLHWMDDETRKLAIEKADAIRDMIGFPDYITDPEKLDEKYQGLNIKENEYFNNNIHVSQWLLLYNMQKLDKPSNKSEWEMAPTLVNAYYTPSKNQIVFPAGILQSPFYDPNYPKSLNFGAMGVVMGHELTHAFDDQGREYDKRGNLQQWWKNKTIQSFTNRAQCFIDQYSKYNVNGDNLNGKTTLGENMADNGGLKAAFHAYEGWLKTHEELLPLPGVNLTHQQLFYIGFAQVWCSAETPEATKLQIMSDSHSPAKYRVIGTLSNSREFARVFQCPSGTKMNPREKCEVW